MGEKNKGLGDLSDIGSGWNPEEKEAAFAEYIEWGNEELDRVVQEFQLTDESQIVIGAESEYFNHGKYHVMRVDEAREVIQKMRESDNVLSQGHPTIIAILSADPEEFEKHKTRRIRDNQKRLLSAIDGYDDTDPVFYFIEEFDKMHHIHESTVADMRRRAFALTHADVLNSVYAIPKIISVGDPDFDQEAWARGENERRSSGFIAAIEKAQKNINTVGALLDTLEKLDKDKEVTLVLRGETEERFKLTAAEAHMKVRQLSFDQKISNDNPPLLII